MSKFKISGQKRRNLKRLLNKFKSLEKNFWYCHQLDKDMSDLMGQNKIEGFPMSDEEAQKRYDKLLSDIDRITKQLEEKAEECPICHKVGFHKMSCPTQKSVVFVSDENPEQKEVRKRLIDRAVELQNECEEYMQKIREKLKKDE